jgi:ATP-dependent Clp protease ATP-binding subunit ClpC
MLLPIPNAWGRRHDSLFAFGTDAHVMETTPRCRQALTYAKESLSRFGHSQVSSAHLVLGLLTLSGGVGDGLLRKAGLSVESVEGYLSLRRSSAEPSTVRDGIPLGESALRAFERAEAEACRLQHTYLGVEHLLLGILGEEVGEAADLFASVHIERGKMARAIQEEIQ